MATSYGGLKQVHDLPEWEPVAAPLNAAAAGCALAYDMRQGADRHPWIYHFASATVLNAYNPITDEHVALASPAMGTFGAGCAAVFVPSAGPSGVIAGGATTTSVVLSTVLPAAVGVNQLANRGDGVGFKLRLINNIAGGGQIAEVVITGNTGGTTPTITWTGALAFTPGTGTKYEILSGRVFLMATAAAIWKYYDIATNSYSGALTTTNLTAPAVDTALVALDEQYTPTTQAASAGMFGQLTATASTNVTNATVTGTSAAPDASLVANEYANFQLRIVQDTSNPTAVGQRIKITSHTGANPTVYTCSGVFGVAPSATAKYVIEGIGDILAFTGSAVALSHTYAAGGFRADGAWSTGATNGTIAALQVPARGANTAAGIAAVWAFAVTPDAGKNTRRSFVWLIRGGAVATIDVLDIAALTWSSAVVYGNSGGDTFTTGTAGCYDSNTNNGMYWYLNLNGGQRFRRIDLLNRVYMPWNSYRQVQGAAHVGERMAMSYAVDGVTIGGYVNFLGATQSQMTRALAPPSI